MFNVKEIVFSIVDDIEEKINEWLDGRCNIRIINISFCCDSAGIPRRAFIIFDKLY